MLTSRRRVQRQQQQRWTTCRRGNHRGPCEPRSNTRTGRRSEERAEKKGVLSTARHTWSTQHFLTVSSTFFSTDGRTCHNCSTKSFHRPAVQSASTTGHRGGCDEKWFMGATRNGLIWQHRGFALAYIDILSIVVPHNDQLFRYHCQNAFTSKQLFVL